MQQGTGIGLGSDVVSNGYVRVQNFAAEGAAVAITASYQARPTSALWPSHAEPNFFCKKSAGALRWLSRARDGRGGGLLGFNGQATAAVLHGFLLCGHAFRAGTSVPLQQALKAVKRSVDLARDWAAS